MPGVKLAKPKHVPHQIVGLCKENVDNNLSMTCGMVTELQGAKLDV